MTTDVALRDGGTVHVRCTVAADVEPLAAFLDALAPEARWFRFLGAVNAGASARMLVERGREAGRAERRFQRRENHSGRDQYLATAGSGRARMARRGGGVIVTEHTKRRPKEGCHVHVA